MRSEALLEARFLECIPLYRPWCGEIPWLFDG
jgi:hypothetical protein